MINVTTRVKFEYNEWLNFNSRPQRLPEIIPRIGQLVNYSLKDTINDTLVNRKFYEIVSTIERGNISPMSLTVVERDCAEFLVALRNSLVELLMKIHSQYVSDQETVHCTTLVFRQPANVPDPTKSKNKLDFLKMFKFYRDPTTAEAIVRRREENLIGHDRFCQHRTALPRNPRRRQLSQYRKPLPEEEIELTPSTTSTVPPDEPSISILSGIPKSFVASNYSLPSQFHSINAANTRFNSPDKIRGTSSLTPRKLQNGRAKDEDDKRSKENSINPNRRSIGRRFISSIATTLSCHQYRHGRNTSIQYNPKPDPSLLQFNFGQLHDELVSGDLEGKESFLDIGPGILRLERGAGHRLALKYLDSAGDRYVLIDLLPDIGWRSNRLWYLVSDTLVSAERILTVTPCSVKCQSLPRRSANEILQACQSLQHPYICPILDLELVDADAFGRQFIISVSPVIPRGSLRDVFHKSQWTDRWDLKYNINKVGQGLTEIQVQRLSCQILEGLLELRYKGLPSGVGRYLHPGNILIQHGTARFSGLENILFGHPSRTPAFLTSALEKNPELLDVTAFAYLLYSMATGLEVNSRQLTPNEWTNLPNHPHVVEVIDFILKPQDERQCITLIEISHLNFYRNLDLRELRGPPPSSTLNYGPQSNSAVHFLVEFLNSAKGKRGEKSKSFGEIACATNRSTATSKSDDDRNDVPQILIQQQQLRSYSSSTPSIQLALEAATEDSSVASSVSNSNPANHISNSMNSSEVSVYWTPPNSLSSHAT